MLLSHNKGWFSCPAFLENGGFWTVGHDYMTYYGWYFVNTSLCTLVDITAEELWLLNLPDFIFHIPKQAQNLFNIKQQQETNFGNNYWVEHNNKPFFLLQTFLTDNYGLLVSYLLANCNVN